MKNIVFKITSNKLEISQELDDGAISVLTIASCTYFTYDSQYHHQRCYLFTASASFTSKGTSAEYPTSEIYITFDTYNSDDFFRTLVDQYKLQNPTASSFLLIEDSPKHASQQLRTHIQTLIPHQYTCPYQGGWLKPNNIFQYTGAINQNLRSIAQKSPATLMNEIKPVNLLSDITEIASTCCQIANAFNQIQDCDTHVFLFLYYHYCYTASLFGCFQSEKILCLDIPDQQYREAFKNALFPSSVSEYVLATDTKRNFLTAYRNTNDIPFIITETPTVRNTTLDKLKDIVHQIYLLQQNSTSHFNNQIQPFVEDNFAVPIVFTKQPLNGDSLYHIFLEPDSSNPSSTLLYRTPIKSEQLTQYLNYYCQSFTLALQETLNRAAVYHWPNIYIIFYTLYNLWEKTCSTLRIKNPLQIHEDPDCTDAYSTTDLLNRYLPKISTIKTATPDNFIETLKRLAEDGTIPIYDRLSNIYDDLISYSELYNDDEPFILKHTDSNNQTVWSINRHALKAVIDSLPGQNLITDVLKMLQDKHILEKSNINEQSYQKRYTVYYHAFGMEGDWIEIMENVPLYCIIMPAAQEEVDPSSSAPYIRPSGKYFHLGKDMTYGLPVYWDFEANTNNKHMLITGGSGSGKSYFLDLLIKQASKQHMTTVVIHMEGKIPDPENSIVIDMKEDTPGIDLSNPDLFDSDKIFSLLKRSYRIDDSQKLAVQELYDQYCTSTDSPPSLYGFAQDCTDFSKQIQEKPGTKKTYMSKPVFRIWAEIINNKLYSGEPLIWDNYCNRTLVLDFSGYADAQTTLSQISTIFMVYFYQWQKDRFKKKTDAEHSINDHVLLIVDEFQHLNTNDNSIISEILREGRKYGVSFWLASQTVKSSSGSVFNTCVKQADLRIFFDSGAENNKRLKNLLSEKPKEQKKFGEILFSLKQGQFIFAYSDICTIPVDDHFDETAETKEIQISKTFFNV